MKIYHFSNADDLKILRAVNLNVEPGEDLTSLLPAMFDLMHQYRGIGLAAPQVGNNKRFFIIEIKKGSRMVFINPEIIYTSIETTLSEEGCLSLVGLYAKVERPTKIKMQATNERGKVFTIEAEGLMSVCLQHEFDHLNGKLFIDYQPQQQQERLIKQYLKLEQRRKK